MPNISFSDNGQWSQGYRIDPRLIQLLGLPAGEDVFWGAKEGDFFDYLVSQGYPTGWARTAPQLPLPHAGEWGHMNPGGRAAVIGGGMGGYGYYGGDSDAWWNGLNPTVRELYPELEPTGMNVGSVSDWENRAAGSGATAFGDISHYEPDRGGEPGSGSPDRPDTRDRYDPYHDPDYPPGEYPPWLGPVPPIPRPDPTRPGTQFPDGTMPGAPGPYPPLGAQVPASGTDITERGDTGATFGNDMTQLFATQYLQQLFNQNPMAQDPYQQLTQLLSSSNVIPQDAFQGIYGVMQGMPMLRSPEGQLYPNTQMPTEFLTQNMANDVFRSILQPGGGYPLPQGMMGGAAGANMSFMDWSAQNPAYLSGPELLQQQVRGTQQFGLPGQGSLDYSISPLLQQGQEAQQQAWMQALMSGGAGNQMMDLANRVQAGDFGAGPTPTATTPGFGMPTPVGTPGIQQPLENVLSQNLMQGNLNPEFIQAQREMTLEPAQENLMGQLNQMGGGIGGLSSGQPAEAQRRLERDFMNQMTTLGFQGQQNALDQSRMLGGQQFGQGFSNQQLMQQAMQQQAGMQQQTRLANLGMAGQYGLFGAGQGLQAAGLAGNLMQGAGGLDLGRVGQLGDISQGMYGGGLAGYGTAAQNMMNQWGTTQQLQSQPEMNLESILQGRRAQDIGALNPYLQQQSQLLNLVTGNLDRSMQWASFQEAQRQQQMGMGWNAFLTEAQERFQREIALRQGQYAIEAAREGGGSAMGGTLPSLAAFALASILFPKIGIGEQDPGGGFQPPTGGGGATSPTFGGPL